MLHEARFNHVRVVILPFRSFSPGIAKGYRTSGTSEDERLDMELRIYEDRAVC